MHADRENLQILHANLYGMTVSCMQLVDSICTAPVGI